MRSILLIVAVLTLAGLFTVTVYSNSWAADYNDRYVRNYPPGYYGMWYYAERFFESTEGARKYGENYRWDKFMSRVTNLTFPFFPIPYEWDYGTGRTFNLPDYNANDWR